MSNDPVEPGVGRRRPARTLARPPRHSPAEEGATPSPRRVPIAARPSAAAAPRTRLSASAALAELREATTVDLRDGLGPVAPPSTFGARRGQPGSAHSGPTGAPRRGADGDVAELDRPSPVGFEPIILRSVRKKSEPKKEEPEKDKRGRLSRLRSRVAGPVEERVARAAHRGGTARLPVRRPGGVRPAPGLQDPAPRPRRRDAHADARSSRRGRGRPVGRRLPPGHRARSPSPSREPVPGSRHRARAGRPRARARAEPVPPEPEHPSPNRSTRPEPEPGTRPTRTRPRAGAPRPGHSPRPPQRPAGAAGRRRGAGRAHRHRPSNGSGTDAEAPAKRRLVARTRAPETDEPEERKRRPLVARSTPRSTGTAGAARGLLAAARAATPGPARRPHRLDPCPRSSRCRCSRSRRPVEHRSRPRRRWRCRPSTSSRRGSPSRRFLSLMLIAGLVAVGLPRLRRLPVPRHRRDRHRRDRHPRHPGDLGDPRRSHGHAAHGPQRPARDRATGRPHGVRPGQHLHVDRGRREARQQEVEGAASCAAACRRWSSTRRWWTAATSCGSSGSSAPSSLPPRSTPATRSRSSSGACRCGCPRRHRRCARWCAPTARCRRRTSPAPARCRARRRGVRRGPAPGRRGPRRRRDGRTE